MAGIWYRTVSTRIVVLLVLCLGCGFALGMALPPMVAAKSERVVSWEEAAAMPGAAPETEDAARTTGGGEYGPAWETVRRTQEYDGYAFAVSMPIDNKDAWISWMRSRDRGDTAAFLEERWALARSFVASAELKRPEDVRAFLLAPREDFVRTRNKGLEYADTWLPIG